MNSVSIFTPTHNPIWLRECYDSIKDQDFLEWVIVPNNLKAPMPEFDDPRIKIKPAAVRTTHIGALKRYACSQCKGDILLELDHDDLLATNTIKRVRETFTEKPDVGFVYSNCANFSGDIQPSKHYSETYGWRYRPFEYHGHKLEECRSQPPTPASISKVWFSANHVRAWRRPLYEAMGGHSSSLEVLDDQDIVCRTFLAAPVYHLDECLYLYRYHDKMSTFVPRLNQQIQSGTLRIYDHYIRRLAITWAKRKNLPCLYLGGKYGCPEDCTSIDISEPSEIIADLKRKWPFNDNSVGVIIADNFLEHLPDKLYTIKEIHRVLCHSGYLLSHTPSTDGRGAYQDPTHCSYYNENSFLYYTHEDWAKWIDTPVRFQELRRYTTARDQWGICYVVADLLALKEGLAPPGRVMI